MNTRRYGWISALVLLSAPAHAHDLSERYGDFLGALLHPLTTLDHAGAFLALGLLAGLHDAHRARYAVLGFNLALFAGAMAPSLLSIVPPHLTTVNVASLAVLGMLTALAHPLPAWLVIAIAVFFGLSHGFENGSDIGANAAALRAALGVTAAGVALTLPAAALAHALAHGWPRVGLRVAGSWIAAIGLMVLGLQIKG